MAAFLRVANVALLEGSRATDLHHPTQTPAHALVRRDGDKQTQDQQTTERCTSALDNPHGPFF